MTYQFQNIRVLVIESTKEMSDLTKSVLSYFGVGEVHTAYGARAGFDACCKLHPDLIIIDWLEEPDNGLELTKLIRNDDRSPNPFVPILMMTGFSQKKRVVLARDSGITEFLVKPFTAKALYQKIEHIIEVPRHFVVCDRYFGPDRRRKRDEHYDGKERRAERTKVMPYPPERLALRASAVEKAREIQKRRADDKKGDDR